MNLDIARFNDRHIRHYGEHLTSHYRYIDLSHIYTCTDIFNNSGILYLNLGILDCVIQLTSHPKYIIRNHIVPCIDIFEQFSHIIYDIL